MAPFRGGSGDGGECFRDPDVESVERRREARVASEKARRLLEERRRAQDALRAQVLCANVDTRDTAVHHLYGLYKLLTFLGEQKLLEFV